MATYAIVAAVSYLLGSIPFGYILVRIFLKQDIRTTGSGNIGATNVGRTGHKGLAIATLLLDAGKGAGAVLFAMTLSRSLPREPMLSGLVTAYPVREILFESVAALFAVAGHMFPAWLRFKGGKGVATAAGAFAVISPTACAISFAIFLVTVIVFRYVSLGSIIAAAFFPVALGLAAEMRESWRAYPWPAYLIAGMIAALMILKHHANIGRLLAGTENRLGAKKAQERPA